MEKIKQLNTLIEQACSDTHSQPPVKLYSEILHVIESRVDLPKHSIVAISKKLTHKSKKTIFITFDLLEYLSYNLQLPFFSQIATKQFLFKMSGLMINKETDALILDKILKFIKCLDEIFRPLEDFLPLFFQFEAGLLRKQYQIPYDYVSPYRPRQMKQYKKPQKTEEIKKKKVIEPTRDQQKRFQQIRQKLILTNEIISNTDPSKEISKNDLLQQLMESLKQSEKVINQSIDQNPSEKILELALATNDDLVTTYRRYKDLQRNRKPETFFMAELASDIIKEETGKSTVKKNNERRPEPKIESKLEPQKYQSIFEAFQQSPSKKVEQPKPAVQLLNKKEPQNIFDMVDNAEKATEVTQITNALDIMDISLPSSSLQNNNINLDLLGSSNSQNQTSSNIADIFSIDLGLNPSPSMNSGQGVYLQSTYQQPANQQSGYQQSGYQQPIYQQNIADQFSFNAGYLSQSAQQPIYQNITLGTNEQKKPEQQPSSDPQKDITDLSSFKF